MDGGRASLVLAALPPSTRPDGPVLTDDPAWIRDPARDVLLDDVLLADRYAQRRYDAARDIFSRLPAVRFPGDLGDYAYAFVQAHVDLAVRVERVMTVLEDRGVRALSIPVTPDRQVWAATEAARRLGIAVEDYPPATAIAESASRGRDRVARMMLRAVDGVLLMRYRRRQLRLLTADLGLLDRILPHLHRRSGVLAPGLGVAERAVRRAAAFAWVRHANRFRPPSLTTTMPLDEAARVVAIQEGGPLPDLITPARDAFSSGSVDAVVLSDDKAPLNHAMVRLAEAGGIPSLVVQHGITGHPVGFLPIEASRFASWGRACSEWLFSRGASRGAVVETGDPRYDVVFRQRAALRAEGRAILGSLGVPSEAKVAVFFSQPAEGRTRAFQLVLDSTASLGLRFVTKVHPAERLEFYSGLAAKRGQQIPVTSGSANPYLCAADVVLTQSSGLAVVAAQLGTPVVLVEPMALDNIQAYDDRWPRATDAASLRAHLESILRGTYDLDRLRGLGEECGGPADGRAGERVARVIEGMVSRHP